MRRSAATEKAKSGGGEVRWLLVVFVLGALLLPSGTATRGQSSDALSVDDWHFENMPDSLRERRQRILSEILGSSASEWAGLYIGRDGVDGSHPSLLFAPRNGFLLYFAQDGPYVSKVSYGAVTLGEGMLRLRPDVPIEGWDPNAFADEFQCIRWGTRRFLVPPRRLIQFCSAVSSTSIHEIGSFLEKTRDAYKAMDGWPEVPEEYRHYLRSRPVTVSVVGIDRSRQAPGAESTSDAVPFGLRVRLRGGRAEGVTPEMGLWLARPRNVAMFLRVEAVAEHTSEAMVTLDPDEDVPWPERGPKIGWTFRN